MGLGLAAVDLHAHVLPGLDDGPDDVSAALELLRALATAGVERVCATPHVQPSSWPVTAVERDRSLQRLRRAAAAADVAIDVLPGGEVDTEYALAWSRGELARFALGGGPALLLEFPWGATWPVDLVPACRRVRRLGFVPVVAHPERILAARSAPERLDEVLEAGAVLQVTAGSLAGRFGAAAELFAEELLAAGRATVVATDVHNLRSRAPFLPEARARLLAATGSAAALDEAPARVLAGERP